MATRTRSTKPAAPRTVKGSTSKLSSNLQDTLKRFGYAALADRVPDGPRSYLSEDIIYQTYSNLTAVGDNKFQSPYDRFSIGTGVKSILIQLCDQYVAEGHKMLCGDSLPKPSDMGESIPEECPIVQFVVGASGMIALSEDSNLEAACLSDNYITAFIEGQLMAEPAGQRVKPHANYLADKFVAFMKVLAYDIISSNLFTDKISISKEDLCSHLVNLGCDYETAYGFLSRIPPPARKSAAAAADTAPAEPAVEGTTYEEPGADDAGTEPAEEGAEGAEEGGDEEGTEDAGAEEGATEESS